MLPARGSVLTPPQAVEPHSPADAGRIAGLKAGAVAGKQAGNAAALDKLSETPESEGEEYVEPGFPKVLRVAADVASAPAPPQSANEVSHMWQMQSGAGRGGADANACAARRTPAR